MGRYKKRRLTLLVALVSVLTAFGEVDQDHELMPALDAHNVNSKAIETFPAQSEFSRWISK